MTAPAAPSLRGSLTLAAIAACLVLVVACCALVLAGYEPPLNGLTVVAIPGLFAVAWVLARGRRLR